MATTILETSLRTLGAFLILLLLTRFLGKKQLSQMTFFTYITGIALGNIAAGMAIHGTVTVVDGITGMTFWALLTIGIEYISLKSPKLRVLMDGEPSIVIKNGKINKKAMASNKLNIDDLSMLLRDKNIFSVQEVDYAILEPNGKLSVLKKIENESVTRKDMQLPVKPRLYLPTELIVDGNIVHKNLTELQLSRAWLEGEVKQSGVQSIKEVMYAEIQYDGSVYIDKMASE